MSTKVDDLKRVIRLLVKEEVKKAVAEEVQKAMGKILVEIIKEVKSGEASRVVEQVQEEPTPEVIHTRNPRLNSVLAETARHSRPLPRTDSLAEIMGGDFEKIGQSQEMTYEEPYQPKNVPMFDKNSPSKNMDFLKQMVGDAPLVPQQKSVLDSAAVPDVLKGVFKKDFRKVMKKIDESAKGGGSGLINAGQLFSGESDGY